MKPCPLSLLQCFCSQIYCCTDYQQLVEFTLTHGPEATYPVDELIDIQPHAPYGSKQARRAAKERAAQRMRDREIARQRAAGANQANFYACMYGSDHAVCAVSVCVCQPDIPSGDP